MNENLNTNETVNKAINSACFLGAVTRRFTCKKIRAGKYEYRGWIISCVGYYEPEQRVCWEAYDPNTGCADFHGFSKQEIKWLIDEDLSKNGR
jgi:hypothetical protein